MTNTADAISGLPAERNTLVKINIALRDPKSLFIALIGVYFVILMHYFQHNVGGSGLDVPINPLGWVIVSCLVGLGLIQTIKQRQFIYNRYLIIVSVCCALLLIPLLYSGDVGSFSYARLLGLFAGLGTLSAFYQMQFSIQQKQKILWLMLAGVLLESLFALAQFYLFPFIPALNMNIARPSAIFFQANVAATFFVTGLMLSLYLLHVLKTSLTTIQRYFLLLTVLTTTIATVLLQSRTGFLGCIVAILLSIWAHRSISKQWLTTFIVGIAIAFSSMYFLSDKIRSANIYTQDAARTQIYSDSFNAIKRAPFLGHGYGTFGASFREQQALAFKEDINHHQIYGLSHPHNELVLWTVEGGVISLTPLLVIMIASGALFYRQRASFLLLSVIFPISLHLFTEFPFYHSVASYLTFILMLGLIADNNTKSASLQFNYPRITYALIGLGVMVNAILMANLMSSQHVLTNSIRQQQLNELLNSHYLFMSDDFEIILNESLLHLAITHDIKVGATAFNQWALPKIEQYPRERYFQHLIQSYEYLKQPQLADKTRAKAKFLFPTKDWTSQKQQTDTPKNVDADRKRSNAISSTNNSRQD